jgi:hypothetical protein
MFKQRTAYLHARGQRGRLWQEGFFEHVVRAEEDFESIVAYIVWNPVRAGLCQGPGEYEHLGSSRYTLDELGSAIQIVPNWRLRSRP